MVDSSGKTKLCDGDHSQETDVKLVVENSSFGLAMHVDGYGTKEDPDAAPIYIENRDGQLRVILRTDIDSGEPTVIDMGNAKLPH
jgi:hypothetical protein